MEMGRGDGFMHGCSGQGNLEEAGLVDGEGVDLGAVVMVMIIVHLSTRWFVNALGIKSNNTCDALYVLSD